MLTSTFFEEHNLARAEAILKAHPTARQCYQGELYDKNGNVFSGIVLKQPGGKLMQLNAQTCCELFMLADGSIVRASHISDHEGEPAGLEVRSTNQWVCEGEFNSVALLADNSGAVSRGRLQLNRLMLAPHAPARLCTVGFGMMALTAYRMGLQSIELYAAGRGPTSDDETESFVGYAVWPKLGFDASLEAVDLNRFRRPELSSCKSVQDIRVANPAWWSKHGWAQTMVFDLQVGSRSWGILLNYIYQTLVEDLS